jgi:two-component system CheB/CheR fusion protein
MPGVMTGVCCTRAMNNEQPESPVNDEQPESPDLVEKAEMSSFPIVGIGASAGGLNAFEQFFTNMPPDSGIAFVLVQHLDPTHASMLVELVQRYTRYEVFEAEDGTRVEPNKVYIIPPNSDIALQGGKLLLLKPDAPRGFRLPIDFFFRSLAEDQKDKAICIVLSGAGSDGTLGLKAIKSVGGLAIVQDPITAKYDRMPSSAIATDMADFVLAPEDMPTALIDYVRYTFGDGEQLLVSPTEEGQDMLQEVFAILRAQTGHDFSQYKKNTIGRRIERRMVITQNTVLEDYARYLRDHPVEVDTLFKELLIGVTRFFREPEAFGVLEKTVIPAIFEAHQARESIRIWVPGCSTGEEAFSVAILFHEYQVLHGHTNNIQVFATDIDVQAIGRARLGVYPDNIAADVSQERLEKYFDAQNSDFRVNEEIRHMIVFAPQNVIKDPPFSNLDLISCRNLLIYLDSELQRRVLSLFHYALRPDGFLFLGTSETIGDSHSLFEIVDRKQKVFRWAAPQDPVQPAFGITDHLESRHSPQTASRTKESDIQAITERYLLEERADSASVRAGSANPGGHDGRRWPAARGWRRPNGDGPL